MPIDLQKIKELWGPHKKFPLYFVDTPNVNELLEAIPGLIDEVVRLQTLNKNMVNAWDEDRRENSHFRSELGFYANHEIYKITHTPGFDIDMSKEPPEVIDNKESGSFGSVAGDDCGARARAALERK